MRNFIDIINHSDDQLDENWRDFAAMTALGLTGAIGASEIGDRLPTFANKEVSKPVEVNDSDSSEAKLKRLNSAREKEIYLLALTMWGEARNGGPEAMKAVGHVVMNRLKSPRNFGDTITEVVWKRKAFSCWNPSDPNREAMRGISQLDPKHLDYRRFKEAREIARKLVMNAGRDPTNGALFYHTEEISPYWAKGVTPVAKHSGHVFYRQDRKATTV